MWLLSLLRRLREHGSRSMMRSAMNWHRTTRQRSSFPGARARPVDELERPRAVAEPSVEAAHREPPAQVEGNGPELKPVKASVFDDDFFRSSFLRASQSVEARAGIGPTASSAGGRWSGRASTSFRLPGARPGRPLLSALRRLRQMLRLECRRLPGRRCLPSEQRRMNWIFQRFCGEGIRRF